MTTLRKINDLSASPLRTKFLDDSFKPETNIAVGMGRVSTKKQKDQGQSDAAQLETIDDYAKKMGLNLVKVWDVAETASKHHKRHRFKEMLELVRKNSEIKHIVFSHQSRSNRNRESAHEIENLIRQHGVVLHCARDHLQLNAKSPLEDWLRWDIFNGLNEKHIKDHTRNVMDGVVKRLELGLFPCKAPFGYRNVRRDDELSIFKFDESEASYVKRAFEWYVYGDAATGQALSVADLKRKLDRAFPNLERTISTKKFHQVLRNPFYFGDFIYDGVQYKGNPNFHPPLIDFALWKKAQDRLDGKTPTRQAQRAHPYIGLVRCGGFILDHEGNETDIPCGYNVTGEEKRKPGSDGTVKLYYYWHCSNNDRRCSQRNQAFMRKQGRKRLNYSEAEFEAICGEMFKLLQFPPEVCTWMQHALLDHHQEQFEEGKRRRVILKDRHEMLSRYIDQAYDDKLSGKLPEDTWSEKNSRWVEEREQIMREISASDAMKQEYIEQGVLLIELTQRCADAYFGAKPEGKRKLIEIVSSNRFLKDGTLRFEWKKPFDLLSNGSSSEVWWRLGGSNS